MKIVANNKMIRRNKRIGNFTTIGSLVVLGLGLYVSFTAQTSDGFTWSMVCLILGFLMSQVGIFFGNRWGRSPRPDELITNALKGLDDKYILYHYMTAVSHLLVGPAGVWILLPFQQQGSITYDPAKKRLNQKGGNWYMKLFAQEGIGRPDQEVTSSIDELNKFIKKEGEVPGLPEPEAVVVFVHPKSNVNAGNAYFPALHVEKLKDFIRGHAKREPASLDSVRVFQQLLPSESID